MSEPLEQKADPLAVRRVLPPVIVSYALTHLGYFTVMPILPVLLEIVYSNSGAWFTGAALFVLTFFAKIGSMFVSGWMHRTPVRRAVATGLILAATGFLLAGIGKHPAILIVSLGVVGMGVSINGVATRSYVATQIRDRAGQNSVFSVVQVVVNVAASVGPIIANLLLGKEAFIIAMLGASAAYALSAIVVIPMIDRNARLDEGATRAPLKWGLLKVVFRDPRIRQISLVVLVGSFLYGQFFSSFALLANQTLDQPLLRAGFYTLNAILVVAVQFPATWWVNRRLRAGHDSVSILLLGLMIFGIAFLAIAVLPAGIIGAYCAIAVFSIGETVYTPMVNTAFVDASAGRPVVEAFNLRQIASSSGEALGSFAGGSLFVIATQLGHGEVYWLALGGMAGCTALVYMLTARRNPSKTKV